MLSLGIPFDEPDDSGRTPLWLAATKGDVRCVHLLVKAGARLHLKDFDTQLTPGESALNNNHMIVVTYLIEAACLIESGK